MVMRKLRFQEIVAMFSVSTKFKKIIEDNRGIFIKKLPRQFEFQLKEFSTEVLDDFFLVFGAIIGHLTLECRGIDRRTLDTLVASIYNHCKALTFIRFRYAPFENARHVSLTEHQLNAINRDIDIRIFPYDRNLHTMYV